MALPDGRLREALDRLPVTYAAVLRLRAAGATIEVMAAQLEIEPEAVGPLLAIAEAKLARILTDSGAD